MNVGEKIKIIRKEKGISTYKLADIMTNNGFKISQSAISKIENGNKKLDIDTAREISKALQAPITELDFHTGRGLTVDICIKDTHIFKNLVSLLKIVSVNENVPIQLKNNIEYFIRGIMVNENIKTIVCQNCGALLVNDDGHNEKIYLPEKNIKSSKGLVELKCHCGCITQYHKKH